MNSIILSGRLTRDPELKFGINGKAYGLICLAVDKKSKKENENNIVNFINCITFGKTAEFIFKYFNKGKKILLSGRLEDRHYEKNGEKRVNYVVVVNRVEFADSKVKEKEDGEEINSIETSENDIDDKFPF